MYQLALFTPWPPQHSGIADYAFDLASGLAQEGVHVSVFTDAAEGATTSQRITIHATADFPGPEQFDRVVYQMGNNAKYHRSMIIPLARYGGVVHLHDMVLHHMVHDLTSASGQGRLYYRLVKHWYGRDAFERVLTWNRADDNLFAHSDGVTDVPLFDPIVCYANGCIVHSDFCRRRIERRFPALPCDVIPQTYRHELATDGPRSNTLRVGVFGSINPNKHTDQLLWAAKSVLDQGAAVHIDIAGNLDCGGRELHALVAQLNMQQHVTFHGRVEEATFYRIMQSVDLCVALRYPTMGETSGVVSRALQMGIPTIVNDVGWYAELPACVAKLPVELAPMQQQLASLLTRHACDRTFHERVRGEAIRYAQDVADFDRTTRRYLALLSRFPRARPALHNIARSAA